MDTDTGVCPGQRPPTNPYRKPTHSDQLAAFHVRFLAFSSLATAIGQYGGRQLGQMPLVAHPHPHPQIASQVALASGVASSISGPPQLGHGGHPSCMTSLHPGRLASCAAQGHSPLIDWKQSGQPTRSSVRCSAWPRRSARTDTSTALLQAGLLLHQAQRPVVTRRRQPGQVWRLRPAAGRARYLLYWHCDAIVFQPIFRPLRDS